MRRLGLALAALLLAAARSTAASPTPTYTLPASTFIPGNNLGGPTPTP